MLGTEVVAGLGCPAPPAVGGEPLGWPAGVSRETDLTAAASPPPRPHTRVLVVANQKGGVGKTTTTVNVAAALAADGRRVLVVDLDPQGNASTALSVEHSEGAPSVYDVLIGALELVDVVRPCPHVPGLTVAPATIDLAGAEVELVPLVARETRLRRALERHLDAEALAGRPLDFVFVDCPPSLGLLTVNALTAADEMVIPIQCEFYALEGLTQLIRTIDQVRLHLNEGLRISAIVLTMFDARTRLAAEVAAEVRRHFGSQVLRTSVPRSVRIAEAPGFGQPVMSYDADSIGALAYRKVATELAATTAARVA